MTQDTYFCNFLQDVTFDSRKSADSVNYELSNINFEITNTAILDGQQRLTSLFLSLFGQARIRQLRARRKTGTTTLSSLYVELDENKITIDEEEYNSKKFDIKFSIYSNSSTQFEIKNILAEKFQNNETREQAIETAIANVPVSSKNYARNILKSLHAKIFVEKLIRYTEMNDMKQDDALEMFVRFNSGGKALKKSEITMSILEAYWPSARNEFGKMLVGSYEGFGTDFIVRTALMLYGDVVKSNINKKIAEALKNNWSSFKKALNNLDILFKGMKIDVNRFKSSWNVLLPIIYCIYYNVNYNDNIHAIRAYLLRAILFTFFQSGTTGKLQKIKSKINDNNYEITVDMLNRMSEFEITDGKIEDVLNTEKGNALVGEILYFLSFEWLNKNYKYEQDHLQPHDRFDQTKPTAVLADDWRKWRSLRNRVPNLHLLEGRSNGSKNDMRLVDYYNDMNDEQKARFHKETFIPYHISLEFENFENFYNERKKLLTEKIRELLS